MGIESGDLLGLGFNFIVVVTSQSVNVYGHPDLSLVDMNRMLCQAAQNIDKAQYGQQVVL